MGEPEYSLRIEDDGNLFVRWGPGGSRFWRDESGQYYEGHFALGGSGGGPRTPVQVAERLSRRSTPLIEEYLIKLGWTDVLEALTPLRQRDLAELAHQQACEARKRRRDGINALRSLIPEYEALIKDGVHLDERRFTKYVYEKYYAKHEPIDENEFSPQRFGRHVNAILGQVKDIESMKNRLKEWIEEERRDTSETDEKP